MAGREPRQLWHQIFVQKNAGSRELMQAQAQLQCNSLSQSLAQAFVLGVVMLPTGVANLSATSVGSFGASDDKGSSVLVLLTLIATAESISSSCMDSRADEHAPGVAEQAPILVVWAVWAEGL